MRLLIFLLISTFLMGNSCKKNLPDSDEYYFRCKVDGQDYTPNSCANCMVAKILGDTTFLLNGNRGFETIAIGIIKLNRVPISISFYTLNDNPQQRGIYKFSTTTNDKFETDATRTGQIQILTLDKTNRIISGNFSFQAYNPVQDRTVNITEGKFRLRYSTN